MASAFSHALVAFAIGRSHRWTVDPQRFWVLTIACSILPDLDVLAFTVGIPYEHVLGHRGLTHSLFFACLVGIGVVRVGFPDVGLRSRHGGKLIAHFSLVTASHGVLDAFTDGGRGVAFFAPFENGRYFFPWTPVKVSPIGIVSFFSERGMQVLGSELLWIGIPAGLWLVGVWAILSFSSTQPGNKSPDRTS
ncbi:MAG: membrane protein [Nitrospirales bacterium]|nr:MAG: membrane protein [Nitrospirales bacterium]